MFLAHIYKMDLFSKTVDISWLAVGCGAGLVFPADHFYSAANCGELTISIDVYFDGSDTFVLLLPAQF